MSKEAKYQRYAEKIRIFKGLKPEEVSYILHCGKVLYFHEGQTIFHEGMLGSNLFIVLSGEIGIHHRNELIAKCKVGDAFGEMAVLNHEPRTATACALTQAKCFTLDEKEMAEILQNHVAVKLLMNIIHVLSERLEASNAYISTFKKSGSPQ
jgi:CRP-like cAMP-binding protein